MSTEVALAEGVTAGLPWVAPGALSQAEWAVRAAVRKALQGEAAGTGDSGGSSLLLNYQLEITQAIREHRLVATDKSRRVGATWGVGFSAVIHAGAQKAAGGMDVLYLGYNLDMAREFIDTCGMWAKAMNRVAPEIQEFLFKEEGEKGEDRAIQAFRISFASGFEIVALSSKPRSLRGRQGLVILDEFAFHDDADELLKSAMALLIWGGKVVVISTHNGVDNPFNKLILEINAEKRPGKVVRVTYDDALDQGLFERVCLTRGLEWSPEAEAAERAFVRKSYGDGAAEELDCIPSASAGAYLSRALIEARMSETIPVLRWKSPAGMVDWPEIRWRAEVSHWCSVNLDPILTTLDPRLRSVFGQDFARSGDLSVIHPMQITRSIGRTTPFILEMRDMPFEAQKMLLFYIVDRLPRFSHGALDAGGNGAFLAEVARQRYGTSVISEIKAQPDWYMLNMPKLKAAFEDGTIELPRDDDIANDYRSIQIIQGIPRVPKDVRIKGADGYYRHGDAAVAGVLAIYASGQDTGIGRADPLGLPRSTPALFEGYAFSTDQLPTAAQLDDFRSM